MRLKSVFIDNYKNLKNFGLTFEGDGFIDIFVGKNGSGKSNFLEALIEIFNHIYEFQADEAGPGFDYALIYSIDEKDIAFEWIEGKLSINGEARRTIGRTRLPDNILVYYSGQNAQVSARVERFEANFRRRIRGSDIEASPFLIGIGAAYKKLLIPLLLLLPEETRSRQFLCEKLGILGNKGSMVLTLNRPIFAERREYDHLEPADLFWGASGVTRDFLDELISCVSGGATPGALHNRETDQYNIAIDVALFRKVFEGRPPDELFRLFNNLKILRMLGDISMVITLQGIEISDLGLFSDGQFQSVYIFAISELFKDRNCITLLDEPDAFLHPEWQFDFLRQTHAISEEALKSNHILMSSHSAATLIPDLGSKIKYFDLKEGVVNCYSIPKRVAIEKLSSNLIRYTEKEQLLSIINAIQIENKPVLFTEGSIDPIIIKEAWHRLYKAEIPFIPFYAFSCSYLRQLLTDERISKEMNGLPVFGLFDFDKAYDHWNGMTGELVQTDLLLGMIKKIENRNAYAVLLPVPENAEIRAQVIKDAKQGVCFGGDSLCEIEHLFYGDPKTAEFFDREPTPGGGTKITIKSDAQKERFANEVIPTLEDGYFEVFKPMFEFIHNTMQL
jgi:predicted ATPase